MLKMYPFGLGVEAGFCTLFLHSNVSSEVGFVASGYTTKFFGLYGRKTFDLSYRSLKNLKAGE